MPPPLGRPVADAWDITCHAALDFLAITPAIKDSVDSQLHGRENGPGLQIVDRFRPEAETELQSLLAP